MAVLALRETWKGRGGDSEGIASTRLSRAFVVVTSNRFDDEATIVASGELPTLYEPHPTSPACTARRLEFSQRDESPRVWDVTVEYSSEPLSRDEQDTEQFQNPLLRPARIRWNSVQYAQAIDKDINGKAITNSAGDFFDPPPEVDRSRWVATVSKNVSSVPPFILTYADGINASPFTIGGVTVEAEKAKLMQIEISELQVENEVEFYVFTFSMEFRKEGWKLKVLDQGLRQKVSGTLKDILVEDPDDADTKRPASAPVLLDGEGAPLSNPSPDTAVFEEFDVYESVDFSVLPMT